MESFWQRSLGTPSMQSGSHTHTQSKEIYICLAFAFCTCFLNWIFFFIFANILQLWVNFAWIWRFTSKQLFLPVSFTKRGQWGYHPSLFLLWVFQQQTSGCCLLFVRSPHALDLSKMVKYCQKMCGFLYFFVHIWPWPQQHLENISFLPCFCWTVK